MITSISQAAANALAGLLGQKLTGVTVEPRWPSPDKDRPAGSNITVAIAGQRQDTPIPIRQLSAISIVPKGTTVLWQVAACTQPLQLDVWTESDVERDDLIAQLDRILNAGESTLTGAYNPDPVGHGVLLVLADGWETSIADYTFDGPDYEDLSDTVGRSVYRATIRGDANFMLTVAAVSARQALIQFKLSASEAAITGSEVQDTYPIT